jgi:hypothetical protein
MSLKSILEQLGIEVDEVSVKKISKAKRDAEKDASTFIGLNMSLDGLEDWDSFGNAIADHLVNKRGTITHEWLTENATRCSDMLKDAILCKQHGLYNRQAIIAAAYCRQLHEIFSGLGKLMRDMSGDLITNMMGELKDGKCLKEKPGIVIDWRQEEEITNAGHAGLHLFSGLMKRLDLVKEERNKAKETPKCEEKKGCCT